MKLHLRLFFSDIRLIALLICMAVMLTGCATSTGGLATRLPAGHAASVISLNGNGFQLAAAVRPGEGESNTVFIEGDGRPWISGGRRVSDDPTPGTRPCCSSFLMHHHRHSIWADPAISAWGLKHCAIRRSGPSPGTRPASWRRWVLDFAPGLTASLGRNG